MNPTPLQQLALWADGTLTGGDPARTVTRLCTDSRRLEPGEVFLALRGEHFDGHDFVPQALVAGAAAVVVAADYRGALPAGLGAVIRVADTLAALQAIAARYRAALSLRVVALTGSSGKTSTKDFLAAVLAERFRVVKTQGNFNNHIGLPLTMLNAAKADEIGVFELGMNHPGEIAPLAAMARPEVGVITNIGVAHIEHMGSRDGIALEKGRLAEALPVDGLLVLPASDEFSAAIAARSPAKAVFTGIGNGSLRATVLETGWNGSRFLVEAMDEKTGEISEAAEVALPVPGVHMIENALLALAVGRHFGIPLEVAAQGLAKVALTHGRLQQKTRAGIHFLDDTYNANPDSMRAAVRTLIGLPTPVQRIAVLGRMGELGAESDREHTDLGRFVAESGVNILIAVGAREAALMVAEAHKISLSSEKLIPGRLRIHHVATPDEAAALLAQIVHPGDLVLVKGSRSARMEALFNHPAFHSAT